MDDSQGLTFGTNAARSLRHTWSPGLGAQRTQRPSRRPADGGRGEKQRRRAVSPIGVGATAHVIRQLRRGPVEPRNYVQIAPGSRRFGRASFFSKFSVASRGHCAAAVGASSRHLALWAVYTEQCLASLPEKALFFSRNSRRPERLRTRCLIASSHPKRPPPAPATANEPRARNDGTHPPPRAPPQKKNTTFIAPRPPSAQTETPLRMTRET